MANPVTGLPDMLEEVSTTALQQMQQVLAQKDQNIRVLQNRKLHDDHWMKTKSMPSLNLQRSADAVFDGNDTVYIRQGKSDPSRIYCYQLSSGEWMKPVQCDGMGTRWSMVYCEALIIVGGAESKDDKARRSSKIIPISVADGSVKVVLPDMTTGRSRTAALTFLYNGASLLVVIGGEDDSDKTLQTVSVLNMTDPSGGWSRAQDIPETLSCSSAAIANGYIYILGGWNKRNRPTSAVFRCQIDNLIATCLPFDSYQPSAQNVWETLPDLPVQQTTCTTFQDNLIVVGGVANEVAVRDIRYYNENYKRWEVIGYLPHPRYLCFAVGLPDRLVVIGGRKDTNNTEDSIEIYIAHPQ